jgi:hypothetical protein
MMRTKFFAATEGDQPGCPKQLANSKCGPRAFRCIRYLALGRQKVKAVTTKAKDWHRIIFENVKLMGQGAKKGAARAHEKLNFLDL